VFAKVRQLAEGDPPRREHRGRGRRGRGRGRRFDSRGRFTLPGGAYATAVMREVMKTVPQRVDDTPEAA